MTNDKFLKALTIEQLLETKLNMDEALNGLAENGIPDTDKIVVSLRGLRDMVKEELDRRLN